MTPKESLVSFSNSHLQHYDVPSDSLTPDSLLFSTGVVVAGVNTVEMRREVNVF